MERPRINKEQFIKQQHYDKIPSWNIWQCMEYLCCSDVNQGLLEGASPGAARAAAVARIEALVSESSSEECIREADYAMIINTSNAMKVVMESVLPGAQFPVLPHGGILEDLATDLAKLEIYTQEVVQFLQKHDAESQSDQKSQH